jgi:hypothetical protein
MTTAFMRLATPLFLGRKSLRPRSINGEKRQSATDFRLMAYTQTGNLCDHAQLQAKNGNPQPISG